MREQGLAPGVLETQKTPGLAEGQVFTRDGME